MPSRESFRIVRLHLWGFFGVVGQAAIGALALTWVLQFIAMMFGESYDWGAVLVHLFLSLILLALFPGQTLWTYRIKDQYGQTHTIVGRPPDPDEAAD